MVIPSIDVIELAIGYFIIWVDISRVPRSLNCDPCQTIRNLLKLNSAVKGFEKVGYLVTTQVQSSLVHGSEVCGLTVILIRMESNED